MPDQSFGYGQMSPTDQTSEYNAIRFVIDQALARVRTAIPCKVTGVTGTGGPNNPAPKVSVQPLVSMLDGEGNATEHGTLSNISVLRIGAGGSAIVIDPLVGDLGWLMVADRDISNVASTGGVAIPGSGRVFDLADGVYVGALFAAAPTTYISIDANAVNIKGKSVGLFDQGGGFLFIGSVGTEEIVITDGTNNKITLDANGVTIDDKNGNHIRMRSTGTILTDVFGHQIQMNAAAVNIVAPALQVNGVPVTVP